jgi:hypothetical protein
MENIAYSFAVSLNLSTGIVTSFDPESNVADSGGLDARAVIALAGIHIVCNPCSIAELVPPI